MNFAPRHSDRRHKLQLAALCLAFCLAATSGGTQSRAASPLSGAWRLMWLEELGAGAQLHRPDCSGQLVFTPDGNFSVQVMYRTADAAAAPNQYSQGGYEASFGRYVVNESAHTFTLHVDGALVRSLVGKDLARNFEISGNQMVVKSTNPEERWRAAWQRN